MRRSAFKAKICFLKHFLIVHFLFIREEVTDGTGMRWMTASGVFCWRVAWRFTIRILTLRPTGSVPSLGLRLFARPSYMVSNTSWNVRYFMILRC